ncbi:MAG: signal peptidase II [Clostridia bacterium]|nr:signal peptidase II [Clostridia bacterium]
MYLLPWGLIVLGIIGIDALTKYIVSSSMFITQSIPVIKGVFSITYVKNTGASFGMLPGGRWFFIAVTLVMLGIIIGYTVKRKEKNKLYLTAASFIVGGGIGNLIDRILTGEVVDFFDFCLIDFAIFNVADCFIVVGVILMLIYCFVAEMKEKKAESSGDTDGNV